MKLGEPTSRLAIAVTTDPNTIASKLSSNLANSVDHGGESRRDSGLKTVTETQVKFAPSIVDTMAPASQTIPPMENSEDESMPTKKIDLIQASHTIGFEHLKSDRRKESVSQGSNIVGADRSGAWHRSCQVPNVAASSINASQAGAAMHGRKRNVPPETEANSDQPGRTTMLEWNVKKRRSMPEPEPEPDATLKKSYGSSTTAHAKESHCKPGSKPNTEDTIKANTMASKKPLIGLPITSRTTTNSDKDKNNVAKKSAELRTSQTSSLATATAASRPRSQPDAAHADKDISTVAKKSAEPRASRTSSLGAVPSIARPRFDKKNDKGLKKTRQSHASEMLNDKEFRFLSC